MQRSLRLSEKGCGRMVLTVALLEGQYGEMSFEVRR